MVRVESICVGPFQENCYLVINEAMDALLIDPGAETQRLIAWIDSFGVKLKAVLLTHGHFDHVGALDAVRDYYQIEAYIDTIEQILLQTPAYNLSFMIGQDMVMRPAEHEWDLMGSVSLLGFDFEVKSTPGHSPGHVSYYFPQDGFMISGDVIFKTGIGRTDLPMSDYNQLMQTIQDEFMTMDDAVTIYPGHGPATQIGWERANNPFLQ